MDNSHTESDAPVVPDVVNNAVSSVTCNNETITENSNDRVASSRKKKEMGPSLFDDVTFDDVLLDTSTGVATVISIKGYKIKDITQKSYRAISKYLRVSCKGKTKETFFNMIALKKLKIEQGIIEPQQEQDQQQPIKLTNDKEESVISNKRKRQMFASEQLELEKQKFLLEKVKIETEIKKAESANQKMKDEHQRYLTDQLTSLTQQIISLRKQLQEESLEENKKEIENLIQIIMKKRDEIEI